MRTEWIVVVWVLSVAMPDLADAQEIINNGLAPPNPANVIDGDDDFQFVFVENVGCDSSSAPCPKPWGPPTRVAVAEGETLVDIDVFQSSSVEVVGGAPPLFTLSLHDAATATIAAGATGSLLLSGSSSATVRGGWVGILEAMDSSSLTIEAGQLQGPISAFDSSSITIRGGVIETFRSLIWAEDTASIAIRGGDLRSANLEAYEASAFVIRGGVLDGEPHRTVAAFDSSVFIIVGSRFAVDGKPVGFGPIEASSGTLTGRLESGDRIDRFFCHDGGCPILSDRVTGLIALVPEPDRDLSLAAAGLALATLRKVRLRGARARPAACLVAIGGAHAPLAPATGRRLAAGDSGRSAF